MRFADLTPIEGRLLAYLDQRGPSDRRKIVCDLASPESRAARGFQNGSNGAAPLIVGKWGKRLVAAGWVKINRSRPWRRPCGTVLAGYYESHEITPAGRAALRES